MTNVQRKQTQDRIIVLKHRNAEMERFIKQETLEEAAEKFEKSQQEETKWQQEQDKNKYSEEEIMDAMKDSWIDKHFSEGKFFSEQRFLINLRQFNRKNAYRPTD